MVSSAEMEVFLIPTRIDSMFCWSLSSVRRSSIACCWAVIRSTKLETDVVLDNGKGVCDDRGVSHRGICQRGENALSEGTHGEARIRALVLC